MSQVFVHLRVHSEYALVDGTVRIKPLVQAAKAGGMGAVALTDPANLFGLVKFYKAAVAEGVKPIVATDVWVGDSDSSAEPSLLVLLATRQAGYRTLSRLLSRGYAEARQSDGRVVLPRQWLQADTEGLIALSGAAEGDVGRAILSDHYADALNRAKFWQQVFPEGYYLEIQRLGRTVDESHIAGAVRLSADLDIPLVATNDVRFLAADGFEAHEVRVCIQQGRTLDDPRRVKNYTENQYFKSPKQMLALFEDIPQAVSNTVKIAERCSVVLGLGQSYLPEYPVPEGQTMADYLAMVSRQGLDERFQRFTDEKKGSGDNWQQAYFDRLDFELNIINGMGFPGYFLIVMEFIQWSKRQGIPVGPGRGSGAGSLVAYALKITYVDPLEYDL
ncbi:MAG: PHP domain-containing protein, partial [Proteobacteria bacterium]|nr:PHP domain-containing protein [Pseudomonadota bacterium]